MDMKKLDLQQRPRERLIRLGASSLSDYELLAIMLGSGTKDKSVLDLACELINEYGLEALFQMDFAKLSKISGIKEAKASKLMACFEIAKRCMKQESKEESLLTAQKIYEYARADFAFLKNEQLLVLYVDAKCRVLKKSLLGGFDVSFVDIPVRKIIGEAISCNAFGLFLIHNHPTGDVSPSEADMETTRYLYRLLKQIPIYLLDHLIISGSGFYSFNDEGLLK